MRKKITTKKQIENYYQKEIYLQGVKLQKNGRIGGFYDDIHSDFNEPALSIDISDTDSNVYTVTFSLENNELTENSLDEAYCNCPYFFHGLGDCDHMVAAFLEYLEQESRTKAKIENEKETNSEGINLLELFVKQQTDFNTNSHTLKPTISNIDSEYPQITLTVGKEKMYVIRSIPRFITSVLNKETVTYGKGLTFVHEVGQFDDNSQKLISILSKGFTYSPYSTQYSHYSNVYEDCKEFVDSGRGFEFDGNTISLFFNTYLGEKISVTGWTYDEITLVKENPTITVKIRKSGEGATLMLKEDIRAYGNVNAIYILLDDKLYSCDSEFSKQVFPLLNNISSKIYIGKNDLPKLGSIALPLMKKIVEVSDSTDIAEKYTPDECTTKFYFDISDDYNDVIAKLNFQYRDIEVSENPTPKQLSSIKQNVQSEELAKSFLKQYFTYDDYRKCHTLDFDEDTFLTEEIENFKKQGDVFLSQKFKSKFVSIKKKPVLGVSVSNDLLSLDIDTGEFPAEELAQLYNSFLKKRKYHKLRDGRFLFLENSGFEKVAEISHMLQLTDKDLKKKTIELPAYRGLYLDSVLTDANDSIILKRNQDFRHMMKDFKSIQDSDYQPSEDLNAELKPYQILGFQWLKTLETYGFGGILADEMGLGKTIQAITYLLSINQTGHKLPNIVICPASLLINWRDELQRFAPSLSVMLLIGNAKEREEQLNDKESKKYDVWITSYDLIRRDRELYKDKKFNTCILDEAQNIKNQFTIASKTVKDLNTKQRFVLTGTPIENRLSELWNLFDFLMPGYLFTHNTFLNKLEKPIVNSDEPQARKQLNLLVQPFIMRRLKKDVLKELPDKLEYIRKINQTEEERKIYIAANQKILSKVSTETSSIQILAMLTHLRQLCCDPNLCFDNYKGKSSKLEACIELCQTMASNGHKILLFSQFTSMLDIIRDRLNEINLSNLTIEGSTTKVKRAEYVKQFQEGNTDVFLISLKAGGTGLNLTKADVVIHYDPWWNQAAQNQATDRAHRMGQEEHVQVYKLITEGTIEEKILKLQEKKAALMESIFQETGDTKLSKEDILDLLEL